MTPDPLRMKKLLALISVLTTGVLLSVPPSTSGDEPVGADAVPGYAVKLTAKLVGTNLTGTKTESPFISGRKAQYSKEKFELRVLAELEKSDIKPGDLLWILWGLIGDARALPRVGMEMRRILPLTSLTADQQDVILKALDQVNVWWTDIPELQPLDEKPNLKTAFEEAKKVASQIPKIFPIRKALLGSLDALQSYLLGTIKPGDCYETDPNCQFGSNKGVIGWYVDRVNEDHELALSVIRFALAIRHADYRNRHTGDFQTTDRAKVNVWPLALQAANGDVDRALETVAVFGHDVCCNRMYAKSRETLYLTNILNSVAPNVGSDNNPISNLYAPGALDGAQVPDRVLRKLHDAMADYNRVRGSHITLRAGYYHLYGGLSSARVLLSKGYSSESGLRLSTLFPEALGHFYKRLQVPRYLSADAAELWKLAEEDEGKVRASVPKDWTKDRAENAVTELEFQIAIIDYTEAQHRAGAFFAFNAYKHAY